MSSPKYIFVVGGVLSGVGKGIVTASLGLLLKSKGFEVTAVKIDPYLNLDAGLMRPAEHGETFVTEDGGEIDQDLGNYERFMGIEFHKSNNITSGKVYQRVLEKERSMEYGGRDVEPIPDVVNEIKTMIDENINGEDFVLVEVGGTTGDIENELFLHAAREIGREKPSLYVMVTYLPLLKTTGELKTKPTQHAVAHLRKLGIVPDFIVTRNEIPIDDPRKETIAKRCFIDVDHIIDNPDAESIYDIPLLMEENGFVNLVLDHFNLSERSSDLDDYKDFAKALKKDNSETVKIGLIGKYVKHGNAELKDSYVSVLEAIKHAAGSLGTRPVIKMIDSAEFENGTRTEAEIKDNLKKLDEYDGLIVPQGWGSRGSEGKVRAIRYIREKRIPFLGLCYGMQMATIEFARNVLGLEDANSEEIDKDTQNKIIHIMPDQKEYLEKHNYGGTIRLGGWECILKKGSYADEIYEKNKGFIDKKKRLISERHRHRFEFNNRYRDDFEKNGMIISGQSSDGELVEFIELSKDVHPFFIATQGHPEYKSKAMKPHPLFIEFIKKAKDRE